MTETVTVLTRRNLEEHRTIELDTVSGLLRPAEPRNQLDNVTSLGLSISTRKTQDNIPRTEKEKTRARVQFTALCWMMFLLGWNDGTTGPLLPRIQESYHVGYTIVSLIFIFVCLGFVLGALSNLYLTERIGFGKTLILGSMLPIVGYTLQAPNLPFPVFVMAYTINSVGFSLQHAQGNGFIASLKENSEMYMGFLHACYGAGAFVAPLVATQFAQLEQWSFHYLVSLGIAVSNTIILAIVFSFKTQDECLALIGQEATEKGTSLRSPFGQILRIKAVHCLAFFILVYVGVEVTIGGWIVTFMINIRGGGPSAGYVSAGFFGGLMLGRILLLWLNKKIGERLVLFLYSILAIALELIVWFVPSLVGGAISVAIVGLFLGPMYPIAMNHAGRILPGWLLTGCIGWIAGFGQAGSAALPFVTGAISSKHGIRSLQPFLIAMMGSMMVLWYLVPSKRRD